MEDLRRLAGEKIDTFVDPSSVFEAGRALSTDRAGKHGFTCGKKRRGQKERIQWCTG